MPAPASRRLRRAVAFLLGIGVFVALFALDLAVGLTADAGNLLRAVLGVSAVALVVGLEERGRDASLGDQVAAVLVGLAGYVLAQGLYLLALALSSAGID